MEGDAETLVTSYFKNHLFDKQVLRSSQWKESKKFKINWPNETAHGTRGVRQHYPVDESMIGNLDKLYKCRFDKVILLIVLCL